LPGGVGGLVVGGEDAVQAIINIELGSAVVEVVGSIGRSPVLQPDIAVIKLLIVPVPLAWFFRYFKYLWM
jgi:hypothetical protein